MRDLLILGTGSHAVEMAEIVDRINHVEKTWNLIGFVSPGESSTGEERLGFPVLGFLSAIEQYPSALMVPEYDWPHKSEIPRQRLASLIDPSAFVSRTAQIGAGCVIYPHCYIGSNAHIGDLLFCLAGSVINHEDIIEDGVTLTSSVTVAGNVHVEADCYLGQSCTIREMKRIGRGSLIGMGAVVVDDVAPNSVMIGNPARRLGARQYKALNVGILTSARWIVLKGARVTRRKAGRAKAKLLKA